MPRATTSAVLRRAALALAVTGLFGACTDDEGSEKAFCEQATALQGDNPAVVFDTYDATNPEAAAAELERAADQLRDLASSAPDVIRTQAARMAALADRLVEALVDDDPAAAFAELGDLSDEFREFEDDSRLVNEFSVARCGVTLDPGPPTPGS